MFVYTPRKSPGRKARGTAGRKKTCAPQKSTVQKKTSNPPQKLKPPKPPAQSAVDLHLHPPPPSYYCQQPRLYAPQIEHVPSHLPATSPAYYSSTALVPPSNGNGLQQSKSTPKLRAKKSAYKTLELAAASVGDLNKAIVKPLKEKTSNAVVAASDGILACDVIAAKLNSILTSIDCEGFSGREDDLCVLLNNCGRVAGRKDEEQLTRTGASKSFDKNSTQPGSGPRRVNVFAKVNLYANSRLPAWLPPLKLYLPSYPLICLAAQFSERVYSKPTGNEKETHVDSDWRLGTKAMVIKSVPVDDMNAIVLAIRGSQTFLDWTVNLNSEPASPENFLDDPGNLCHAGFLSVARRMISPIASRLRSLLEEDPRRAACSLILTGHSAGGAIASLLYAHMLSTGIRSELSILINSFKRIHCFTFGAPPVSLLPITKSDDSKFARWMFISFINEGDPVPRADKPYIRSLLDLYSSAAPKVAPLTPPLPQSSPAKPKSTFLTLFSSRRPKPAKSLSAPANLPSATIWRVPPCTLSNAGRCVALRPRPRVPGSSMVDPGGNGNGGGEAEDDVVAHVVTDAELRGVVWGDPIMHMMRVYRRRVEVLATKAVLGAGGGW